MILLGNLVTANGQINQFSLSTGIAIDITDFNWSIAGNLEGKSPNILSELHFSDITSYGVYFQGTYKPIKNFETALYIQHNRVASGNGIDSDYENDNRTGVTYQELFSSNKGDLKIFNVDGQYLLYEGSAFNFSTGISFGSIIQNFYVLNQHYDNLNSRYKGMWKTANIAIAARYQFFKKMSLTGFLSYGVVSYKAQADWNLIEIFEHPVSFKQKANGYETQGRVKMEYTINPLITFNLTGKVGSIRIANGIDKSFLTNNTEISTKFNGANKFYSGFTLGLNFSF